MSKIAIGKPAPEFTKMALMPDGQFKKISLKDYEEIIEFSKNRKKFEELGANIVGASVDSEYCHLAWTKTPRKKGGLGEIDIPLISDLSKSLSKDYGVLFEEEVALRGLFIIDPRGILRSYVVNPLEIGRNVTEILRLLEAVVFHDENGNVCPVNWKKGKKTIDPDVLKSLDFFDAEY